MNNMHIVGLWVISKTERTVCDTIALPFFVDELKNFCIASFVNLSEVCNYIKNMKVNRRVFSQSIPFQILTLFFIIHSTVDSNKNQSYSVEI